MTSIEQHKMIAALREHEARMNKREQEEFEMYRKRDRDDEDLDEISKRRLVALHEKYAVQRCAAANPLDALFRTPPPEEPS